MSERWIGGRERNEFRDLEMINNLNGRLGAESSLKIKSSLILFSSTFPYYTPKTHYFEPLSPSDWGAFSSPGATDSGHGCKMLDVQEAAGGSSQISPPSDASLGGLIFPMGSGYYCSLNNGTPHGQGVGGIGWLCYNGLPSLCVANTPQNLPPSSVLAGLSFSSPLPSYWARLNFPVTDAARGDSQSVSSTTVSTSFVAGEDFPLTTVNY